LIPRTAAKVKPLYQYFKDEGRPRLRQILVSPESLIALLVGGAFLGWGGQFFSQYPKIGDLTTGLIAYASIALGFCVAGLTISLTLPDQDFATKLACLQEEGETTNAYSDLLFVFSWTAIAHWFALIVLLVFALFAESASPLLPVGHSHLRGWIVSLIACICAYCLCQFLITLITLSQVGNVYIKHLVECHSKRSDQRL
jgi:hypothetical protein